MVEAMYPGIRIFRMSRNLGFTGGQNFALEKHLGAHSLILNSDTVVHAGALSTMLAALRDHPNVGMIGPKLLNPDGSLQFSCRRFPNPLAALFRNTPLGRLFPKNRFARDYLMQDWDHTQTRSVDWVSGAALMARGELTQKIGYLDPEFYMYCEDVDWCFRAWKAGYEVMYLPTAVITHAIGRSTDKAPNRMIGTFHKSMFRFYRKNMVPELNPVVRPFALAAAALAISARASLFIAKNKWDDLRRRAR
jgi:GT2 family glycosyltransferase